MICIFCKKNERLCLSCARHFFGLLLLGDGMKTFGSFVAFLVSSADSFECESGTRFSFLFGFISSPFFASMRKGRKIMKSKI